jgi:transcriptional regulator with XRE-family HTH domain
MNRIGLLRERAGLSLPQLGGRLNVDPNSIRRWESEKVEIPLKRAEALADLFDVSLDFLLGRPERPRTGGPGWPE